MYGACRLVHLQVVCIVLRCRQGSGVAQAHLELGLAGQIRHCCTVVQVEVSDECYVHLLKVNIVKEGKGLNAVVARVYATVQHDSLAPA